MDKVLLENEINPKLFQLWGSYDFFKQIMKQILESDDTQQKVNDFCQIIQLSAFSKDIIDKFTKFIQHSNQEEAISIKEILQYKLTINTLKYMKENHNIKYEQIFSYFQELPLQALDKNEYQNMQILFEKAKRVYLMYKYQHVTESQKNQYELLSDILKENFYCFLVGSRHSERHQIYLQLKQYYQNQYLELFMDKSVEIQSLIGNYTIGNGTNESLIIWKDGPLLSALQNQKILILKNFELAQNAVQSFVINLIQQGFCNFKNKKICFQGKFRLIIFTESQEQITDDTLIRINFEKDNLQMLLDTQIGKNLSTLKKIIFDLVNLFNIEDLHKIKQFICRIKQITIRFGLTDSQFLSTQIQQYIIQDILDIFFEGSLENLNRKQKTDELCNILNLRERQLIILLEDKSTDYSHQNNINVQRFQKEYIKHQSTFVYTEENSVLLDKIITSVEMNENVLLVGETGTGKTRIIQEISELYNQKLNVFNLSYSTDSVDIFGGFRPVNNEIFFKSQIFEIQIYMKQNFDMQKNKTFFDQIHNLLCQKDYKKLGLTLIQACRHLLQKKQSQNIQKILLNCEQFMQNPNQFQDQNRFQFVKGILWQCLEKEEWILFDEINMAQEEVLFKLFQVLSENSISLMDSNQLTEIQKPQKFRIFACMNPAYEIGKKPLPPKVQNLFTCFQYPGIQSLQEIFILLKASFKDLPYFTNQILMNFAKFFFWLRQDTKNNNILDQGSKKIVISIRQLKRAISIIINASKCQSMRISLVNSIYMGLRISCYLSMGRSSRKLFDQKFDEIFEATDIQKSYISDKFVFINPEFEVKDSYTTIQNHIIKRFNNVKINENFKFITTSTIKNIMSDILKILAFDQNLPVLLEGPTSTGKTTIIQYLGNTIGQKVVRINNHKDTDLDEYIGKFVPTKTGKIKFQEGQLIECMQKGYWLLLDELNLAKSEVLEALNRVFDDNQELYVPELDQIIIPHKDFRIFATQNPNTYSGRSLLSKAFKNRFICINYDTMTSKDIQQIIVQKCQLPDSRVEIMIKIKEKLQFVKTQENLLNNNSGLITVRDLIKWANRKQNMISKQDLVYWGFALLAERIRNIEQKNIVKNIFEKESGVSSIDMNLFYKEQFEVLNERYQLQQYDDIKWTFQFKKAFVLANQCVENKEPILLVGETGCGKTTLATLLSKIYNTDYYYINCHKNTEVNDFIGNWRPKRNKNEIQTQINDILQQCEINCKNFQEIDINLLKNLDDATYQQLKVLIQQTKQEFEWVNGKMIQAIQNGGVFLIDEISLANDSVLERFNSLLEFERKLFITESEESLSIELTANEKFFIVGTMNPSGDHGKKELSPALRNRFSEIWMQSILDTENFLNEENSFEVKQYIEFQIEKNFKSNKLERNKIVEYLFQLCKFYNLEQQNILKPLTTRDLQSFIMLICNNIDSMGFDDSIQIATQHFFQSSLGQCSNEEFKQAIKNQFQKFTVDYPDYFNKKVQVQLIQSENHIQVNNIRINIDQDLYTVLNDYILDDEKVTNNIYKILLGLQTQKPLMLEGPPGVGKTSLIQIIAKLYNKKLYKVNIFAQTDMMDLLGTDVPDQQRLGHFKWCNGILLNAMIEGAWIIFDELNLASQNVLEGLNSILDHRGEVFIPELNKTVSKAQGFQFFATQNPQNQGRGRKALPQSFLNRFFKIYLTSIPIESLIKIAKMKLIKNQKFEIFEIFYDFISLLLQRELINQKQFNIRAFDRIRSFFYTFYDDQNEKLLMSVALRLFVLQQNWQQVQATEQILNIASNFDINTSFQVAQIENQICLYDNQFNNVTLSWSKNYDKQYHFQDPFSLLTIINQALCLQIDIPMLIIYEDTTSRLKKSINNLAKQHRKKVRVLHLYKNADEQDLLGFYDQFGWEQFLYQINLLQSQIQIIKQLCDQKEQQINYIQNLITETQNQDIKQQLQSLVEIIEKNKQFFKWQDSELVRAVENGDWICIEGCESCSPALLEKLNGLLEEDSLVINECFVDSDRVRKVSKNPEFRIFLFFKNKPNIKISAPLQNRCFVFLENQQQHLNEVQNIFDKNFEDFKLINYFQKERQLEKFLQDKAINIQNENLKDILQSSLNIIFQNGLQLKTKETQKSDLQKILEQYFSKQYYKCIFENIDLKKVFIYSNQQNQIIDIMKQKAHSIQQTSAIDHNIYILLLNCFKNILYFKEQNQNIIKVQNQKINYVFQDNQFIKELYVYSATQPQKFKNIINATDLMIKKVQQQFQENQNKLVQQIEFETYIQNKVYMFIEEISNAIKRNYKECQQKLKFVFQQFYDQQEYENMNLDFFNQNDNNIYLCLLQNKLDLSTDDDSLQIQIFEKFEIAIQFLQQFQNLESIHNFVCYLSENNSVLNQTIFKFYIKHVLSMMQKKIYDFQKFNGSIQEYNMIMLFINKLDNFKLDEVFNLQFQDNILDKPEQQKQTKYSNDANTQLQSQCIDLVEIIGQVEKDIYQLIFTSINNLTKNIHTEKNQYESIKYLEQIFEHLQFILKNLEIQQIHIEDIQNESIYSQVKSFIQNKINSSILKLDLTLQNQVEEIFEKLQNQRSKDLSIVFQAVMLYTKLLQKNYFVFTDNNLQNRFNNFVELIQNAFKQYNSVNIYQVINYQNNPQFFANKKEFLIFQLYQLQWIKTDKQKLISVFNNISNVYTNRLSQIIQQMNSNQNKSSFDLKTRAQDEIKLNDKLNEISQYEYNKNTLVENKKKQSMDAKILFNDYFQDFNTDENQLDQVQKLNISKTEDTYHEQCKNYYFFLSLNYLIQKRSQFKTQISFDNILSILLKNFQNFQISLKGQSLLLKNNFIKHIENLKDKFDLTILHEISATDETDPLKKTILNMINSKIQYSKTFSFYSKKNNMKEVETCFQVVNKVFLSLRKFAIDPLFKENPSLSILLKVCQKSLSFGYNTPLSKIATALQLISKNLQEFNIFLPRDMKLQDEANTVFDLLYQMRKIEKKSWNQMLVLGQNQIENQEVQKVYLQQKIIFNTQDITSIAMIDQELLQANIGNFSQLMFLYGSLLFTSQDFAYKKVLINLLRYYSVIRQEAQAEYVSYQKQIYEPMLNSQKLMNWQFKDIVNLKSNMEKLYRGISKSLKSQKEVLETKIQQCFVVNQRQKTLRNELDTFLQFYKQFIEIDHQDQEDIKYVNKQQLQQISEKLDFLEQEDISYFRIISLGDFMSINSLNNIVQDKEFYKKLNHSEVFDEFTKRYLDRIDSIKDMKLNFKLRCLKDFILDLQFFVDFKRFDISNVFTYRIIFQNLKIINYNDQIKKLFQDISIEKDIKQKFQKMNTRIYKVIDSIRNFKENQIYHDNIPSQFQQKLLSLFLMFYIQYSKYSNIIKKVFKIVKVIQNSIFEDKYQRYNTLLFYLQFLLDSQQYQKIEQTDIYLARKYISMIKQNEKVQFEDRFQTQNFMFINNIIDEFGSEWQEEQLNNNQNESFDVFYSKLRQKFKMFMLSENNDNQNFIDRYCNFARHIYQYFEDINENIKQNQHQLSEEKDLLGLIKMDIQSKILYSIDHLYSFNKFVYNLSVVVQNLLYNGFCYKKQEDEQEEISGSEEMDFGTGMGEGQGDTNVADQIEYEEQLLGEMEDQQQQNQEQNQNQEQDSNQMEMENDFGGQDQQQGENEEQEKQSKENLSENFEDINQEDLDPQMYQESEDEDNGSQEQQDPKSKFELENEQQNNEKEEQLEAKQEKVQEKENQRKVSEENQMQEEEENSQIKSIEENEVEEEVQEQFDDQYDEKIEDFQKEENQDMQSLSIQDDDNQSNQMEIEEEEGINEENDMSEGDEIQEEEKLSQQQEKGMNIEDQIDDENQQTGNQQNFNNQNQTEEDNKDQQQNIESYNQKVQEFLDSKEQAIDSQIIQELIENVNFQEQDNGQDQDEIQEQQEYTQSQQKMEQQTYRKIENQQQQNQDVEQPDQKEQIKNQILEKEKDENEKEEYDIKFDEKKKQDFTQQLELNQKLPKQNQLEYKQDLSEIMNNYENQETVEKMFEQENFMELVQENGQLIDQESDILCEKLKTILDQKQANVLKGDFRTGKKLNMKKIIPYIASNYRKDKIWLRKQDPNEKNYSITIAIDNSASMQEKNVGKIALFSSLILCNAIQKAQLGTLQVCKIETGMQTILKDEQFSRYSYQKIVNEFDFQYADPNSSDLAMANFVKQYNENVLEENQESQKICFIVSDGRMNKELVKKQLLENQDPNVTFFFVILDCNDFENSIINYQTSQIIQEGNDIEIIIKQYLEDFPFQNYIILKDINHLCNLIVDVLTELVEKNNQ